MYYFIDYRIVYSCMFLGFFGREKIILMDVKIFIVGYIGWLIMFCFYLIWDIYIVIYLF